MRRLGAMLVVAALAVSACTDDAGDDGDGGNSSAGEVPEAAAEIMAQTPYDVARWSYVVTEPESGDVLYSRDPGKLTGMGSNAKNFSVGTAMHVLGADHTVDTTVQAVGDVIDGSLDGDLVLVASGDLFMGGRGVLDGDLQFATLDHNDANAFPDGADAIDADPLAGLDELATQVVASGVSDVTGDVVIDDSLWEGLETADGIIEPIVVNDNLVDVAVTPSTVGELSEVELTPETGLFSPVMEIETVPAGEGTEVVVVPAEEGAPGEIQVIGTIEEDSEAVNRVYEVPDPAAFARSLFIEALRRAGVTVDATLGENPEAPPAAATDELVATLTSPPLSDWATLILNVSYNRGADSMLCLLAVDAGSTDCNDGWPALVDSITEAGIDQADVVMIDGAGKDPALVTPAAMVTWLTWAQDQPWGGVLASALPILGERGSLALSGVDSPAAGKVQAKTGTAAAIDERTGALIVTAKALAGYIDAEDGRRLAFSLYVANASFEDPGEGFFAVNDDLAAVAAAFQQAG